MIISDRLRNKVLKTRWQARVFIIVDYSPFRPEWKFFTTRGQKRAKAICKKWVKEHPFGSATIVSPPEFRVYWRANNRYI